VTTTTTTNPCAPLANCPTTTTSTTTAALTNEEKLPWVGTLRARIGILPSQKWLVYATGGLAYGEVQSSGSVTVGGTTASGSSDSVRAGWTAGGGVEAALWGAWSVKVEYLYVDLGHVSDTYTGTGIFTPVMTNSHVTDNIVRAGLNYHFNWQ
jgi:outer membrane immunogenic protein